MALRRYKRKEELQALLDREVTDETRDRPENNYLENALRAAIEGVDSYTTLEVYGYPTTYSEYIFLMEYSDIHFPCFDIRVPLTGHDTESLEEAVKLVIAATKDKFSPFGHLIIIGDRLSCDAFERHLSSTSGETYKSFPSSNCGFFHMTGAQREALLAEKIEEPPGFTIEKTDAESDGDMIHRLWKYSPSEAALKNRIEYLPSFCARTTEGETIGWVMAFRHGQITNLYVKPEYRGRGLGKVLEFAIAKEFARRGQRVFKFVESSNTPVYEGSLRSPFWTLWTKSDDKNNDTKESNVLIYRAFERV